MVSPCGFESHLSHQEEHHPLGGVLLGFVREMGLERRIRKQSGGLFSRRGRVPQISDVPTMGVDEI